jgi:hypothetical protein
MALEPGPRSGQPCDHRGNNDLPLLEKFMTILNRAWNVFPLILTAALLIDFNCQAQIDPEHRNLLELGYDQPLTGKGPQGVYAYYYYNNPDLYNTNVDLRLAIAPAYVDGELGFKQLISPTTDVGLGFNGGAFGANYYEVRQGRYYQNESFDGSGGGAALSVYQLLNPGMLIPINVVARGGIRDSTYTDTSDTADNFALPANQVVGYTREGIRVAGKEPVLYPDLGLELSVWFERDWRLDSQEYGFDNDRSINPNVNLYWLYAGLNYAWTNSGQKISFAFTAGGSSDADQLGAYRLGGVLPLVSEFPLILPGYYYEELTATGFEHFYGAYDIPLIPDHRLELRLEAATAHVDYLAGYQQSSDWQTGVGGGLTFAPKNKSFEIVLRYGYGFNALRDGKEGAQSIGLLFQYNFEARRNPAD